ncbi:MAG: Mur ligase family protein, partial [Bacteroidota bacterium]
MIQQQHYHFIAIGGVIMHNLAIDAHLKGHQVTGSDDEIYDPSSSRLQEHGLLPLKMGWFPEKIHSDIDAVILGMHALPDNPELLKAQELGLKILSFPEYIYLQSLHKQRIVIAGSHGKSSITAMVMHVLKYNQRDFDYLVGASTPGFSQNIRLSDQAPLIIIEGDEYLSSPLDKTPKFLHYHHHIGLISGISWDHMNVYPTFDEYIAPFEQFADASPKAGILIFSQDDSLASVIGAKERQDVNQIPYQAHPHRILDGTTYLIRKNNEKIPLMVFGEHNLKNISGALEVCRKIGITEDQFYQAISSFSGAAKRLQKVADQHSFKFFIDFAHAPSKVKATTTAVKKQFIDKKLLACLELHTYSSLNKEFIPQYRDSFNAADKAIIYFNPQKVSQKNLPPFDKEDLKRV